MGWGGVGWGAQDDPTRLDYDGLRARGTGLVRDTRRELKAVSKERNER